MIVKGIVVLLVFTSIASLFQFDTILWLLSNSLAFGITAVIIIFQPELRRALEELGRKNIVSSFLSFDNAIEEDGFSEKTINEIVRAIVEMSKVKTGALIVIEQAVALGDYERTGISLDALISSQLLVNIFEHNTPLHDGAIIVRGNRIVSATCYLPLTDSLELGKELGTRHRAAVGISEVSDSYTIVVSEETGGISLAHERKLIRNLTGDDIKDILMRVITQKENEKNKFKIWKGRRSHEDKDE
jgi:diadenylate cyclase